MVDQEQRTAEELAEANRRLDTALAALVSRHGGGTSEEFNAARQEVLRLERELARIRNEPFAVPCDFPVKWDVGAPLPFVLCHGTNTFLTFYVSDPDPNWDGTCVRVVDPSSSEAVKLCLVNFEKCVSLKFGHPNEDVQIGHPLAGHGLEGYTAQIVQNSPWIEEVARINSVHEFDKPEHWTSFKHYVFWFHDETFECLAQSYSFEVTIETMGQLLSRVRAKLME